MKQKFEDLKLIIQNDRRVWLGLAIVLVLVFVYFITADRTGQRPTSGNEGPRTAQRKEAPVLNDSYKDLTTAFQQEIQRLSKTSQETSDNVKRLSTDLEEHKTRSQGIFDTLVDRLEELGKEVTKLREDNASPEARAVRNPDGTQRQGGAQGTPQDSKDGMETIGFKEATVPPPPPPPKKPVKMKVISPGDVVPVRLMTGVNAPVDGTPYPVVFKIAGPITGPDGSTLEIGERSFALPISHFGIATGIARWSRSMAGLSAKMVSAA